MKKLLLMSLIMAFRLGSVLLLFVLLARNVSVYEFGLFAKCFGVAAILGFLVDFGFAQSLLRDIAREPEKALTHISNGLSLKLAISIAVILAVPLYLSIFPSDHNPIGLQSLLVGYAIMNSFSEFYGVSLRATGRYGAESMLQALYAGLIVLILLVLRPGIQETAAILLTLKFIHVALMHWVVRQRLGKVTLTLSVATWRRTAAHGTPYAADAGISNISANVDVIILASMLGLSSAGIYQAGQKLVQGMNAFALVFSNVYLPTLSRSQAFSQPFKSSALKLSTLMLGCGTAGALLLWLLSSPLVDHLYGEAFAELKPILPWFGLVLLVRYVNGTAGVLLTALGKQKVRAFSNVASLLTLLALSFLLIPAFGLYGMIYALLVSYGVISILYYSTLAREIRRERAP